MRGWINRHRGMAAFGGGVLVFLGGMEAVLSLLDRLGVQVAFPHLSGLLPWVFDLIRVSLMFAGLLLLWLVYREVQQPASGPGLTFGLAQATSARRWLPNPSDLRSLQLRDEDLERALALASALARELLAPDAVLAFGSLALGPAPAVTFEVSSETARRSGHIVVTEYGAAPGDSLTRQPTYAGPYDPPAPVQATYFERRMGPESPWREDSTWRDLVEKAWYRFRPQAENVSLRYEYRDGVDGPMEFHLCLWPVGPEGNRADCYALRSGELELAYGALG